MNRDHATIFSEYRRADENGRLHIYLQFPELRNDFLEIEQERTGQSRSAAAQAPARKHAHLGRIICRNLVFLFYGKIF